MFTSSILLRKFSAQRTNSHTLPFIHIARLTFLRLFVFLKTFFTSTNLIKTIKFSIFRTTKTHRIAQTTWIIKLYLKKIISIFYHVLQFKGHFSQSTVVPPLSWYPSIHSQGKAPFLNNPYEQEVQLLEF